MQVIDDCFVLFGGFGGLLSLSFDNKRQKKKDEPWGKQEVGTVSKRIAPKLMQFGHPHEYLTRLPRRGACDFHRKKERKKQIGQRTPEWAKD